MSMHASIHATKMAEFYRSGFVGCDSLGYVVDTGTFEIQQSGEIGCLGEIVLNVKRILEIVDPGPDPTDPTVAIVQTYYYAYNASVRNHDMFLRYDNADHPAGPDWKDQHHRHDGDWRTGEHQNSPTWVGREKWPKLGDFISEVETWYWQHKDELPNPGKYRALDRADSLELDREPQTCASDSTTLLPPLPESPREPRHPARLPLPDRRLDAQADGDVLPCADRRARLDAAPVAAEGQLDAGD